jgi:hypothetical protein
VPRKQKVARPTTEKRPSKAENSSKSIPHPVSIHQVFLMRYSEKELTDSLQILENAGYTGDTAIFMMGWVGGAK